MTGLKNILIYFTIFGMEMSWLYALLNAANKSVSDSLSIPLLLVTLLISWAISRSLRRLHWPGPALTILSWVIWPVIMLLMIKIQLFRSISFRDTVWLASLPQAFSRIFSQFEPSLLIFLSTAVLWWLGRRVAYLKADFATAVTESQFGLVMLVVVFFTAYELNLDQSGSVSVAMSFFALALFGIAISHAEDNSWLISWRKGHWSGILLVTIGLILVSGLLISIIFTPELVRLFIRALQWVWEMINRILSFFAGLFPQSSPAAPPPMPSLPAAPSQETPGIKLPDWLRPGLTLVWEILAGGLVLAALWRITSQIFGWMRNQAAGAGGEIEHLKGAFGHDLRNYLKRIIYRIFRIKIGRLSQDRLKNISPEIASVRQIYVELLQWAARGGYPRQPAQTPEEYRYMIDAIIDKNQEDLDFITRQYMDTRYGAVPPTPEKLDQLKQKWHNLRKTEFKKARR